MCKKIGVKNFWCNIYPLIFRQFWWKIYTLVKHGAYGNLEQYYHFLEKKIISRPDTVTKFIFRFRKIELDKKKKNVKNVRLIICAQLCIYVAQLCIYVMIECLTCNVTCFQN